MKRKFDSRLRKVGNSYVITVPIETIERFNLELGDIIGVSFDSLDILKKNNKKENKKE